MSAALDIVGFIDQSGIADGLNAVLQAKEGDWGGALTSAIAAVPLVGNATALSKIKKDFDLFTSAGKNTRKIEHLTSSGRKTDDFGHVLVPSGKPQINTVHHSTQKRAKDAARNEGKGSPIKHPSPNRGNSHYHAVDKNKQKKHNSTHHEY